jgi:hypothetical protein
MIPVCQRTNGGKCISLEILQSMKIFDDWELFLKLLLFHCFVSSRNVQTNPSGIAVPIIRFAS